MEKRNLDLICQLRHELHAHPELAKKEVWTKRHLVEFLKAHTHLEIVEQDHWFYALYRREGAERTIGIRADFDALPIEEQLPLPYASQCPGVSHKCGHDGHSAALAGLALEIDQKGSDKNVVFLFQHAEETGEGAIECVDTLSKMGIDEFYSFHNFPGFPKHSVVVRNGTMMCATVGMTVTMIGAPAHASQPELGRNPANAIAQLACALPRLSSPDQYTGFVLHTIVQIDVGQKAFGMSASRGEISITLRAEHEEELDALLSKIETYARELSRTDGLDCSFDYTDHFSETRNNTACADKVRTAAHTLNLPVVEPAQPLRGAEDFSEILKVIPGAEFFIGDGENYPALHTYEFDFPDNILDTVVEMYRKIISL